MASAGDEELAASKTDGFKVGEKKTVEEYAKLGKPLISIHDYPMVHVKGAMGDGNYLLVPPNTSYQQLPWVVHTISTVSVLSFFLLPQIIPHHP